MKQQQTLAHWQVCRMCPIQIQKMKKKDKKILYKKYSLQNEKKSWNNWLSALRNFSSCNENENQNQNENDFSKSTRFCYGSILLTCQCVCVLNKSQSAWVVFDTLRKSKVVHLNNIIWKYWKTGSNYWNLHSIYAKIHYLNLHFIKNKVPL